MSCHKTSATEIDQIIDNMKIWCSEFYNGHKRLLYSIMLTGSLARREVSKEEGIFDADMLVITRYYYNPLICSFLKSYLEKRTNGIRFDVGRSCPSSRLSREKSLFLYDIKNNGVLLAGNDARKLIRDHSIHDLYPFESIRLLMNASCRLVFSLYQDEVKIRRELNKAMRCCVDAYLLHDGHFAPTMNERKSILKRDQPLFFEEIQEVIECDDLNLKYKKGRLKLLSVLNLIRMRLDLGNLRSLVDYLRDGSTYPFPFKLYTLVRSRHFGSVLANPIFDIYSWSLWMLNKCDTYTDPERYAHHQYFESLWTKLPQPAIYA